MVQIGAIEKDDLVAAHAPHGMVGDVDAEVVRVEALIRAAEPDRYFFSLSLSFFLSMYLALSFSFFPSI